MFRKFKRALSALTAAALTVTATGMFSAVIAEESTDDPLLPNVEIGSTVEAEDMYLNGLQVWQDIYGQQFPGYSGDGFVYVTSGSLEFEVDAPADGMYEIWTDYIQILDTDARQQSIEINGVKYTNQFPHAEAWTEKCFAKVRLKEGINHIKFTVEYGYAAHDTITVKEADFPDVTGLDPTLSDKNATAEAQGLMNYLCDMYGNHILSGQQEIYGGGHTPDSPNGYQGDELLGYESEFEWIKKNYGVYPAIRGFDLMNYNPLYGWDDGSTERIIEWGQKGGIPTICWHINLPTDFTSYEVGEAVSWEKCSYKPNSTFKVANAVIEGTKEYEYVALATECLAAELLKIQEAGVPVLFRPYHEAEGNTGIGNAWFWWGQEGPEPYVALWKQLYTRLTEEYGLHNLIWEFNSYTYATSEPWYPGEEWVDIAGFDKYDTVYNRHDGKTSGPNEDAISATFYDIVDIVDNKKPVALTENSTVPSLENILTEKAYWLYFCIWYDNGQDNFLTGADYNDYEVLKSMYQSDYCITLDELPATATSDWATYAGGEVKPTTPTEPTDEPTDVPTNPDVEFTPGDVNGDGKINVFDNVALKRDILEVNDGVDLPGASAGDVTGDGYENVSDLVLLNKFLLGKDVTFKVYTAE